MSFRSRRTQSWIFFLSLLSSSSTFGSFLHLLLSLLIVKGKMMDTFYVYIKLGALETPGNSSSKYFYILRQKASNKSGGTF